MESAKTAERGWEARREPAGNGERMLARIPPARHPGCAPDRYFALYGALRGSPSGLQMLLSRKAVSWDFDIAPTLKASMFPFLKSISVGIPRML